MTCVQSRRAWLFLLVTMSAGCGKAPDATPVVPAPTPKPSVKKDVPTLIALLSEGSTSEQINAANELGNMGPTAREALMPLVDAAKDDENVRPAAFDAIAKIVPDKSAEIKKMCDAYMAKMKDQGTKRPAKATTERKEPTKKADPAYKHHPVVAAAIGNAQRQKKRAIVIFSNSHCKYCVKLKGYMNDSNAKKLLGKFVVSEIDTSAQEQVADQYRIMWVPTLYIYTGDGRRIGELSGCPDKLEDFLEFVHSYSGK